MTTTASEQPTSQASFLVADCGATNTTVVLFDVVDGVYRLIARATTPTTVAAPWSDVVLGLQQAITHISQRTGRPLLNERGTLIKPARRDGSGVDHFIVVASAAPPLRTLLVGLFDDVSINSARRALTTSYTQEIDCFSLSDRRNERAQVAALIEKQPDLIFLTGGTDGGAEKRLLEMAEMVNLGLGALAETKRPQVVFAGNRHLRQQVGALIGDRAVVRVADNVRPTLETEQIDDAAEVISRLYQDVKLKSLPGIHEVNEWSNQSPTPTARAFADIVAYFAALHQGRVLGVDLGSNSVTLVTATADSVNLTVRTDLGMGRPVVNLLDKVEPAAIAHWLSYEIGQEVIRDFIVNKSVHPQTIPMTEAELRLEHAIARQVIRQVATEAAADLDRVGQNGASPFRLLLARGATLANAPRPGQALLILLDALQPVGIFSVALDRYGLLPALGTLARREPLAVVQALEAGTLLDLGWVVVPTGPGQPGQEVLNVTVNPGALKVDVGYGEIAVVPLGTAQPVEVSLQPARRFDIGFGPGQGKTVTLRQGAVGLVVDARGRPLSLPQDETARRNQIRQWLWDMGA
jgi:uncharacterized protein (TIGR01319 family)